MQHTAWSDILHLSLLPFEHPRIVVARGPLTCMWKHARAHANTQNPDSDDSLYPFANQLYMSRGRESESKEVQQLLVCKQTQSVIIIPSFFLTCSQTLTRYRSSHVFSHFTHSFPVHAQPAPFVPICAPLPSSPHFPPSISPHVNVGHSLCMSHSLNSTEFVSTTKSRESVCRGEREEGRRERGEKPCECQWKRKAKARLEVLD